MHGRSTMNCTELAYAKQVQFLFVSVYSSVLLCQVLMSFTVWACSLYGWQLNASKML